MHNLSSPKGSVLFLFLLFYPQSLVGQSATLPEGIGVIRYYYRPYPMQTYKYNDMGQAVSLADPINTTLEGKSLLDGKGGADLQKLAQELQKYDQSSAEGQSLLDQLYLGEITGHVEADIKAQALAIGYGVSRKFTFYLAIPWINAKTKVDVSYNNSQSNASEIKDLLGDLAFPELKDGLAQAQNITINDVKESIAHFGYAPLGSWKHEGFGDMELGLMTSGEYMSKGAMKFRHLFTSTLTLPTGYQDDPDQLADVGFGKGYYGFSISESTIATLAEKMSGGLFLNYKLNFNTQVSRRVPEGDESLIPQDRSKEVRLNPGDDSQYGINAGLHFEPISVEYSFGINRHFGDRYSGSLAGNYGALGQGSNTKEIFHDILLSYSSVAAYRQKKIPVPFVIGFNYHRPIEQRNISDQTYYQITLSSFFATPRSQHVKPKKKTNKIR